MIVSHIVLKNWRNFRHVDVHLGNRVFLVGPNASGKSNFLDVFRFLRDMAKPGGGLQTAIADRGGLPKIRCLAARKHPDIEIQVSLSEYGSSKPLWTYEIAIKREPKGIHRPFVGSERVLHNGNPVLERPDPEDERDFLRKTQTHLEQISANQNFRPIAAFFQSVSYLHMVPQLLRHPEAFTGPGIAGDPFGRNFLETVARTPQKTRDSRLKKIEKALQVAVPYLEQLTDKKDAAGVPHLEAIYKHWRPKGARQQEDQFSDGTLRLLGLLWALLDGDSLLLLEEPEMSLNAGIVRRLPSLMHQLQRQKKRQIMLSTHSDDLLRDTGIGGEEVLELVPGKEGTEVGLASSKEEIRELLEGGFTIGEVVMPRATPKGVDQLEFELLKK